MNNQSRMNQKMKIYLNWPLWLSILLILMNVGVYVFDQKAGVFVSVFVALYLVASVLAVHYKNAKLLADVVSFAAEYGQVQKQLLKELEIPYGILDQDGKLLWGNDELLEIIMHETAARRSISNVIPDITRDKLPHGERDEVLHIEIDESNYKVVLRSMMTSGFQEIKEAVADETFQQVNAENMLVAIYLYDETEINACIREKQEQRMIVGLLYIDNYEEALESIDEVRRSLLIALVDRKINKYMQSIDAIIKKLEKDKYIIIFKQKYLFQLQTSKFALLDEVRAVNIGNALPVTISLGLGINADSYTRGYEFARAAIDLALGRGGDQAVLKDGEHVSYYGGKSVQVERNTRVKARVKAHALQELVEAKDKVVIMGHAMADVDSLGAAIGVYRIAKTMGKKAHIVINDITSSVSAILKRFQENSDYESDMFVRSEQAVSLVNNDTLLVIVDVNRANYTECPELLHLTKTIVMLDHHRQSGDAVENAVLSYIEPYASSACEMVSEILQYIEQDLRLKQSEADALYSGIMIDTDNFLTKTGVRTFEAAAFLRRNGADVTRIRKMFRSDFAEAKARSAAVNSAEIYMDSFAIAQCDAKGLESPTIVGAQVANELLDIIGIKASFVLTEFNQKIYVSARSIDEINVQIIMEKLGGGGHLSVAGAQLCEITMEQARDIIKSTLNTMREEGEL